MVQAHQAVVLEEQEVAVLEVQELLQQAQQILVVAVVLDLGLEQQVVQELLLLDTQQHKKLRRK